MRILSILVLLGMFGVTSAARGDAAIGDCKPNDDSGCGSHAFHYCPAPPDMSIPILRDMSTRDLASPPDAQRQRRHRAQGRGLIVLSGVSALALLALRRRYKSDRLMAESDASADS